MKNTMVNQPTDSNRESRNILYKTYDKGDKLYCGNYTSKCNKDVDAINCTLAVTDNNNNLGTYPCPFGYTDIGRLSGGKLCNAYLHRECTLKSVNDNVFNPLENAYNLAEGKTGEAGRTQVMLEKIRSCCNGTSTNVNCGNLFMGDANNEPVCNYYKSNFCLNNLDNLSTEDCIQWCAANKNICNGDVISNFCKEKSPLDTNYHRVCGCYYPPDFYAKLQVQLAEKYKIPKEFLSGGRSCYFSGCNGSPLNPYPNELKDKCKSINLSQCFQKVSLTAGGDIELKDNALNLNCQLDITKSITEFAKSCTKDDECGSNFKCNEKKCVSTTIQPTERKDIGDQCSSSDQCKTLYCEKLKCATKPPPPPPEKTSSNLPLIIGLSVGGGLLLLLIIIGIWLKKK
jgi:hypothetical protein